MDSRKKIFFIIGIIVLIIVIIVAAVFIFRRPPQAPPDNIQVSLRWWKADFKPEQVESIIQNFKTIRGNELVDIEVIDKQYGNSYYTDLFGDIARGVGPDIFSLRNDDLASYKEFLAPINIFQGAKLAEYKKSFADLVVRETMDRDKVYGITTYLDTLQLYYNKNLLQQASVPLPPATWDELDRQIINITQKDSVNNAFFRSTIALGTGSTPQGSYNITNAPDILPTLIFQAGGHVYDYQKQRSVLNSPKNSQDLSANTITQKSLDTSGIITNGPIVRNTSVQNPTQNALKFYSDFATPTNSRYTWNSSTKNDVDLFIEGRLAYIIHYQDFSRQIEERNNRLPYDIAPLPQLDQENKRTMGNFLMDVLNRKLQRDVEESPSDKAKLKKYNKAQEFMAFLSGVDSQRDISIKSGRPAAHRQIIKEQLEGDRTVRIFAASGLYADSYYKPDVKRIEKMWLEIFQRVEYQNIRLDQSIQQAAQEYEQILSQQPKQRI